MSIHFSRFTKVTWNVAMWGTVLLLTACRQQPSRPNATVIANPSTAPVTGIPACDNYLSSYLVCHRAAGIFSTPPNQLQDRYQAMRNSLLQSAQDQQVRPQLAKRCIVLANQLHDALHGKSCDAQPVTANNAR